MKRAMDLLVLFCLSFAIAMVSAETDSAIENDLIQMSPSPSGNPSHWAKDDLIGENISNFWPEIPFLERFWSSLFPLHRQSHQRTTHMPRIIWRIRLFLVRNNSDELLAASTEGATDSADQVLVQKIGPTIASPVITEKNLKSSRRKRNKEHKDDQLAESLSLRSYMNIDDLENYTSESEGKNLHKKLKSKNNKKSKSINDISHSYNKSSNSISKNCHFYTYIFSIDWSSLIIDIIVVLIFIFMLVLSFLIGPALIYAMQEKRDKITQTKYDKYGVFQVYSV